MFSNRGFSLIEAVVAIVITALTIVAVGGLGERLLHHRVTADSNSAAMSLAERQLETLLGNPIPNPSPCPTADTSPLCAGAHTAINLNASGGASGPTYRVQWTVVDSSTSQTSPLVLPVLPPPAVTAKTKKITVTVTHLNNPLVNATLVRFYNVS